jgi:hypothetical protein
MSDQNMKLTLGDATRTEEARSRILRISGTLNGLLFVRICESASAIWDLKATSSAIDDSAGESFCKFWRPVAVSRLFTNIEGVILTLSENMASPT